MKVVNFSSPNYNQSFKATIIKNKEAFSNLELGAFVLNDGEFKKLEKMLENDGKDLLIVKGAEQKISLKALASDGVTEMAIGSVSGADGIMNFSFDKFMEKYKETFKDVPVRKKVAPRKQTAPRKKPVVPKQAEAGFQTSAQKPISVVPEKVIAEKVAYMQEELFPKDTRMSTTSILEELSPKPFQERIQPKKSLFFRILSKLGLKK